MMGLVSGNRLNRFWQKGVKPIKEAVAALQIAVEELSKTAGTTPDAVGALSSLKTTVKTNLVAAVNELVDKKIDKSKIVDSRNITEPGFVMDGAECSKALAELYSNSGNKGKILWENPDPTVAFAAQTIELTADFEFCEIYVHYSTTNTMTLSQKVPKGSGTFFMGSDTSSKVFSRRLMWVNPNKLQVYDVIYESYTNQNSALVPVKIIIYKIMGEFRLSL